jgi:hypothetical protein
MAGTVTTLTAHVLAAIRPFEASSGSHLRNPDSGDLREATSEEAS